MTNGGPTPAIRPAPAAWQRRDIGNDDAGGVAAGASPIPHIRPTSACPIYASAGVSDQAVDPTGRYPRKSAMFAYARNAPLPALRPRRMGQVWRLPRILAQILAQNLAMTPETGNWNALLCRVAQDRDRAAFASLFSHFAPRVKAYLLRLGAPAALAEDLAQEALLNLWRKAHLF